jgi:hypothetical protein
MRGYGLLKITIDENGEGRGFPFGSGLALRVGAAGDLAALLIGTPSRFRQSNGGVFAKPDPATGTAPARTIAERPCYLARGAYEKAKAAAVIVPNFLDALVRWALGNVAAVSRWIDMEATSARRSKKGPPKTQCVGPS